MGLLSSTRLRAVMTAGAAATALCALPATAGAETVADNPGCSDLNPGWTELKVEPVREGTFSDGTLTVTISDIHDSTFDWTASQGIDAVIVKGGPPSNIYRYDPEATSGNDLAAPGNGSSEGLYGLSHIAFCYDTEPPPPGPCSDTNGDGHDDDGMDNGNDGIDDCAPPIVCVDENNDGMDDDGQDGNYDGVDDCGGSTTTPPPPPPPGPPPPPPGGETSGEAPAGGSAPAGDSAPAAGTGPDVGGVLGERALSGTARLSAPAGCRGRTFRASVRGRSIARVVFLVDGKRVRSTRKGGTWSISVNPRAYRSGSHKITAKVTFTRASATATRTLRATFLRCTARAVAPRFTG